ncbi:MAG: RagB/SusD family nutrient uptake outer membrane protein [Bacteroidota bacterium]|nr:RagB/SusD family nutrient uptake outer membrane protein [Bacteroidota bacterium]
MKRLNYKFIAPLCLLAAITFYACKKNFLDKQPLGNLVPAPLANKTGVETILVGAYHALLGEVNFASGPSNWSFGSVVGGDSYKGSIPTDQSDVSDLENWAYNLSNPYLDSKWKAIYHGAQRANDVLRTMALAKDLSATDQKQIMGESRFLRGYWHLEAKKLWQNVPFVSETVTTDSAALISNVDASGKYVDIYPQIEADFQFAMDNLPETQPQPGRANKWAAASFLAKTYMFEHKYTAAKALFDQIIASGKTAKGDKYALVTFEQNFNASTDNSAESIFAAQNSVNDGSGTNGSYGDVLNFPNGGGPGGCCGFNNPSISLANSYKTGADGLPLFTTFNSGNNVSDPNATPYSGTLDPRIDWTVGRTGVPYLDWGAYPKNSWIRDIASNGWMSPKKNVYAQSQKGSTSSTETSFWGPTQLDANNTNILRFADLLLMAAEAEVEVGTLHQATMYVNMVRSRAADPKGWVYLNSAYSTATGTYATQTTPADNYLIKTYTDFTSQDYARQAIHFERKLELAMEGHRFFDLQRWDNGTGSMAAELNAYAAAEKSRPGFFSFNKSAVFTKGKNEIYPIPQQDIDIANAKGKVLLKQNPGY